MSDTAIRQKHHKMRNRFRNALLDIQYLSPLEQEDLTRLFPSDELDASELEIVHSAVFAAVYHMIRVDADRKTIFENLKDMVANDVIRKYADKHDVYAPVELEATEVIPPVSECPTLEEVRDILKAGEKIPYKAHMALNYREMHPNPEEYL